MGKVYIGVMAVGGHKLWGGGRKAGCGVRCFGEMGERWKIDGRRRGGCGPGMPGPYGVGSRRGDGTLLRLLPHTQKISLRILCKSRILLL